LALSVLTFGCGPEVPREELGEIVFEIPEVHGTDEPYPMPELGEPPPESERPPQDPMYPPL
jgi:hypothetical protein